MHGSYFHECNKLEKKKKKVGKAACGWLTSEAVTSINAWCVYAANFFETGIVALIIGLAYFRYRAKQK